MYKCLDTPCGPLKEWIENSGSKQPDAEAIDLTDSSPAEPLDSAEVIDLTDSPDSVAKGTTTITTDADVLMEVEVSVRISPGAIPAEPAIRSDQPSGK